MPRVKRPVESAVATAPRRTAAPRKIGVADIGVLRLASQRIVGSTFLQPVEVVRWMTAMQAQDFAGVKWSIGLRTDFRASCTDATVEAALSSGVLVRSWPMRGTLHVTAAEDLHWMLALTTPRLIAAAAARRAQLQLDDATLERAREIAIAHLPGRSALTRAQLLAAFDAAGVSTAGQRGYHLLWHLAQTGTLCFGPPRGKGQGQGQGQGQGSEQTFVRLDEWVKRPRRLARDESLGEWARRYFISHGPATARDFAGWTKLPAADVKIALNVAGRHLVTWVIDGVTHWMGPQTEQLVGERAPVATSSVALLPGFDEYLLGYQDRGAVLPAAYSQRIVPGGNGVFMSTIVVGGAVVGTWRRTKKGKEILLQPTPFRRLRKVQTEGLIQAAKRYEQFMGSPVRVLPVTPP